jgi:hypothetical protein
MKKIFLPLLLIAGFAGNLSATTYYVNGSGTNPTCASAITAAAGKTTVAAGLACLAAGDTLIIKAGTYTEGIEYNAIPSGTSENLPTTVRAALGETVILNGVNTFSMVATIYDRSYILLDGLQLDCALTRAVGLLIGTDGGGGGVGSHYITFQNGKVSRCRNGTSAAITSNGTPGTGNQSDHLTFKNLEVSDNSGATPQGTHGIYVQANYTTIEDCLLHDNDGWGIHQYVSVGSVTNGVFRRNKVYSNGDYGILIGGNATAAYNNIVYNNGVGGFQVDFGASGTEVYSNSIYNNGTNGIQLGSNASVTNPTIQNNIIYTHTNSIQNIASSGLTTCASCNVTANPSFVDAGTGNFTLQSGSVARGVGLILASPTGDYYGVTRGASYDSGAIEYTGTTLLTAGTYTGKTTFESAGYTLTFTGSTSSNAAASVRFRELTSSTWKNAYTPMVDVRSTINGTSNTRVNEVRGSIVGLTQNTEYEIEITLSDTVDGVSGTNPVRGLFTTVTTSPPNTGTIRTIDDSGGKDFTTISAAIAAKTDGDIFEVYNGTYAALTISSSCASTAYCIIRPAAGQNSITIGTGSFAHAITVTGDYWRITANGGSGFTLGVATGDAVSLSNGTDNVYIEDLTITNFCTSTCTGTNYYGGISATASSPSTNNNIYLLRNTITYTGSGVVAGPWIDGVALDRGETWVIADNIINSPSGGYRDGFGIGADLLVGKENIDIARNTITDFYDDGIEADGPGINQRIWLNIISSAQNNASNGGGPDIISTSAIISGPTYIFRNVGITTATSSYGFKEDWNQFNPGMITSYYFQNTIDTSGTAGGTSGHVCISGTKFGVWINNICKTRGSLTDFANEVAELDYFVGFAVDSASWASRWNGNGSLNYASLVEMKANTDEDDHSIQSDPLFTDADKHITSTSPAYNTGRLIDNFNTADSAWPYGSTAPDMGAYEADSAASTTQYGFKFRNDNGTQATATNLASENVNAQIAGDTTLRLRVGVNTSGAVGAQVYQLEFKKSTDSLYRAVPSSTPIQVTTSLTTVTSSGTGTIADYVRTLQIKCWGGGGAGARRSSNNSGAAGGKGGSASIKNSLSVTQGNSYSYIVGAGGTGGATSTNGALSSFTYSSTVQCQAAAGNSPVANSQTGATTSTGSNIGDSSFTGGNGGNGSGTTSGGGGGSAGTTGNGGNASAGTAGSAGTGGGVIGAAGRTTQNNGIAGTQPGSGGSGGFRQNATRDGGNGGDGQIQLVYTAQPEVVLVTSANIAAAAATSTTRQLTLPSGKLDSAFVAGRISDDTNPLPSIDSGTNGFTEVEFAIKIIAANATNGDTFNFRITKNGTPLDVYSFTPSLTLGTTTITLETAANGSGSEINTSTVEAGALGTLTAYSISRDAGVFSSNSAASWSLTNKTGGVLDGDLAVAGDAKSAVLTGNAVGTATISISSGPLSDSTGTITVSDTTAPTAGGSGVITTSSIQDHSITLTWTKATDAVTAQASLQYQVYRSLTSNINSIANAEANGTVQVTYTTDLATTVVNGPLITSNTQFYFSIIVKDAAGNKGFYPMINATTLAESTVTGAGLGRMRKKP